MIYGAHEKDIDILKLAKLSNSHRGVSSRIAKKRLQGFSHLSIWLSTSQKRQDPKLNLVVDLKKFWGKSKQYLSVCFGHRRRYGDNKIGLLHGFLFKFFQAVLFNCGNRYNLQLRIGPVKEPVHALIGIGMVGAIIVNKELS